MAAVSAVILMALLAPAPAAAQDTTQDGDKPSIDGPGTMGIEPDDVGGVAKGTPPPVAAPPSREHRPPARRAAPPAERGISPVADRRGAIGFMRRSGYVWGGIGWVSPDDPEVSSGGSTETLDLNDSVQFSGAAGLQFTNGLRGEVELAFFSVDVENLGGSSASGDIDVFSMMFNGLYELPFHPVLRPYFGGGIGFAHTDTEFSQGGGFVGDDNNVFAYQAIGGVAVELGHGFAVTGDYRYFATQDHSIDGFETEFQAHKVTGGVRYRFGGR